MFGLFQVVMNLYPVVGKSQAPVMLTACTVWLVRFVLMFLNRLVGSLLPLCLTCCLIGLRHLWHWIGWLVVLILPVVLSLQSDWFSALMTLNRLIGCSIYTCCVEPAIWLVCGVLCWWWCFRTGNGNAVRRGDHEGASTVICSLETQDSPVKSLL